MRAKTESALLLVALALVAAFVASFALGIARDRAPDSAAPPPVATGDPSPGPTADSTATPAEPAARVEVLNASGASGLARRITEVLRTAGFDVVFYGNAPQSAPADTTVVLDRTGDVEWARAVARALGTAIVRSAVDSTLLLDVTVWVGKDWVAGDSVGRR